MAVAPNPGAQVIAAASLAGTEFVDLETGGAVTAKTLLSSIATYVYSTRTVQPYTSHTGAAAPQASTEGNDTTPSTTETYLAIVTVPGACTITGVSLFNGSAVAGNATVYLTNFAGTLLASSASTAQSGTDAYQRIAFSTAYAAPGPFSGFVLVQFNNTGARFNSHIFGDFPAGKLTSTTYGTFPTGFSVPTTFTTALGPMASLY